MNRYCPVAALAISAVACAAAPDDAMTSTAAATPKKKKKAAVSETTGTIGGTTAGADDGASAAGCGKMDILFVIDDSASMLEEQNSLAAAFPEFIEEIAATNDGQLDYRIAITTTSSSITVDDHPEFSGAGQSIAPNGTLVELKTCGMTRPWIERGDDNVTDTFSCAAPVGTMGSILEMPLDMMQMALQRNPDFVREDALLAVVILTDEDDGSSVKMKYPTYADQLGDPEDVASFGVFLDSVKGHHRERWATSVIAAPTACKSAFGDATAAPRLQQFASLAGPHGVMSSICDGDLNVSLKNVLATFQTACKDFPPVVK